MWLERAAWQIVGWRDRPKGSGKRGLGGRHDRMRLGWMARWASSGDCAVESQNQGGNFMWSDFVRGHLDLFWFASLSPRSNWSMVNTIWKFPTYRCDLFFLETYESMLLLLLCL